MLTNVNQGEAELCANGDLHNATHFAQAHWVGVCARPGARFADLVAVKGAPGVCFGSQHNAAYESYAAAAAAATEHACHLVANGRQTGTGWRHRVSMNIAHLH